MVCPRIQTVIWCDFFLLIPKDSPSRPAHFVWQSKHLQWTGATGEENFCFCRWDSHPRMGSRHTGCLVFGRLHEQQVEIVRRLLLLGASSTSVGRFEHVHPYDHPPMLPLARLVIWPNLHSLRTDGLVSWCGKCLRSAKPEVLKPAGLHAD